MLFKTRFHQGLRDGSIVRSYRRWKTPRVKVGGRYRFAARDAIEVIRIESVKAAQLTRNDARRSGFESLDQLRREIERTSRERLRDSDELTCVHFRHVTIGPRQELGEEFERSEVGSMVERIETMEGRSKSGPWVWRTLALIAQHPQRRAGDLADMMRAETKSFKSRVRRLKGLGLTRSFGIGYGLTPLGQAVLEEGRRRQVG